MKQLFSILLLALLSLLATQRGIAQSAASPAAPSAAALYQHSWLLQSDEMSGLGQHTALHTDTHLDFSANGRWTSTHPLLGATSGTWQLSKKGVITMQLGQRKEAEVIRLTADLLVLRIRQATSTLTWTWEAPR